MPFLTIARAFVGSWWTQLLTGAAGVAIGWFICAHFDGIKIADLKAAVSASTQETAEALQHFAEQQAQIEQDRAEANAKAAAQQAILAADLDKARTDLVSAQTAARQSSQRLLDVLRSPSNPPATLSSGVIDYLGELRRLQSETASADHPDPNDIPVPQPAQ